MFYQGNMSRQTEEMEREREKREKEIKWVIVDAYTYVLTMVHTDTEDVKYAN